MSDSEDRQPDETIGDESTSAGSPLAGIIVMTLFIAVAIVVGLILT